MTKIHNDIDLTAHLMRRAAFGATRPEIDTLTELGYENALHTLFNSNSESVMPDYMMRRYHHEQSGMMGFAGPAASWIYRMITTQDPLTEKISLFWHGIFATSYHKITQGKVLFDQVRMFRKYGRGNFRNLLIHLSKDPAMIGYLDNHENHKGAINENYGRELLELFSMGVGNYTEADIKEAARAFTGWTIGNADYMLAKAERCSVWPYGRIAWHYEYHEEDHDDGEKTFLGRTGNFTGDDIIDIIVEQPATAKFIARHMYSFFVKDEPPVPQWPYVEPNDPEAIDILCRSYFKNSYNIDAMLNTLFKSHFFKDEQCRYNRVKSPAELMAGVLKLTAEFDRPRKEMIERETEVQFMGQMLHNPPSVEGWTEGLGWIDTGTLMERINFASNKLGNMGYAGVNTIVASVVESVNDHTDLTDLINRCLSELGYLKLQQETFSVIHDFVSANNKISEGTFQSEIMEEKVIEIIRLIAASQEFQRA